MEEGIRAAIKYCSKHDILTEFLEIHGSEVLNMILEEWNTDDAIAFAREEGREDGREEGRTEGLEEGLEKGREAGYEKVLGLLAEKLPKEEIEEIKMQLTRTNGIGR